MSSGQLRLVMRSGPTPGKVHELNKEIVTIGREASADIVIADPEVSRAHARLVSKPGGVIIEDLGSTNGTFVNKQRITAPRAISAGDEITLGETIVLGVETEGVAATVIAASAKVPPAPRTAAATPQAAPVPPPPAAAAAPAEKKGGRNRTLLIGCGCLLLVVCAAVGIYLYFAPVEFWQAILGSLGLSY
ncbi:MAG: FHA domain-containing protein [Chloroflexi bacterium]|nr:FHA domain-containing protein [Chloroflexota bacterium]